MTWDNKSARYTGLNELGLTGESYTVPETIDKRLQNEKTIRQLGSLGVEPDDIGFAKHRSPIDTTEFTD